MVNTFAQGEKTDSCESEVSIWVYSPNDTNLIASGIYSCGTAVMICAPDILDYSFLYWTAVNGVVLSTEPCYEFIALEDFTTLIAHYEKTNSIGSMETTEINIFPNPTAGEVMKKVVKY